MPEGTDWITDVLNARATEGLTNALTTTDHITINTTDNLPWNELFTNRTPIDTDGDIYDWKELHTNYTFVTKNDLNDFAHRLYKIIESHTKIDISETEFINLLHGAEE